MVTNHEAQPLPLFPLPNVVLLPHAVVPLHIFEPRYREMVRDATAGNGRIGMVLLSEGWETDHHDRPPIRPVGCAGRITELEELPDGKYNLHLVGETRFRVVGEIDGRAYRRAEVEWLTDRNAGASGPRVREIVGGLVRSLNRADRLRGETSVPAPEPVAQVSFAEVVHRLAGRARLETENLQSILEEDDVFGRAELLRGFLDAREEARRRTDRARRFSPEDPGVN